jgi:hypothetical protein
MGSSYAYPVLETGDAVAALRLVDRLLDLSSDQQYMLVEGQARLADRTTMRRLAAAVPDGLLYTDEDLPLTLEVAEETPPGPWVAEFVSALGDAPAWLRWDLGAWPAGPFGYQDFEYSGVQVSFNSRDRFFGAPPSDRAAHMVYVCTSMREPERAKWLAEQVGAAVLGEPVPSL